MRGLVIIHAVRLLQRFDVYGLCMRSCFCMLVLQPTITYIHAGLVGATHQGAAHEEQGDLSVWDQNHILLHDI